LETIYKKLV